MENEPKKPTRRTRRKKPPVEAETFEHVKPIGKEEPVVEAVQEPATPVVEQVFKDETIAEMFGELGTPIVEPEPQPTTPDPEPVKEAPKPWQKPIRPMKQRKPSAPQRGLRNR